MKKIALVIIVFIVMVMVVLVEVEEGRLRKAQYDHMGLSLYCLHAENSAGAGGRIAVTTNLYHQAGINRLSRELHEAFISGEGTVFGYPVMGQCIPSGHYALDCHADTYWLFVEGDGWNNDGCFEINIIKARKKNVFVTVKLVKPAKFI